MSRRTKGADANIRVGPLDTVMRVCVELGRVYRKARRGEIDDAYAARLAGILKILREGLATAEFERRIAELEAHDATAAPANPPESPAWIPKIVSGATTSGGSGHGES